MKKSLQESQGRDIYLISSEIRDSGLDGDLGNLKYFPPSTNQADDMDGEPQVVDLTEDFEEENNRMRTLTKDENYQDNRE